jgi:hypothetical protein
VVYFLLLRQFYHNAFRIDEVVSVKELIETLIEEYAHSNAVSIGKVVENQIKLKDI